MGVLLTPIEQIIVEVPSLPDLNFIANVPIKFLTQVVETIIVIWGLDENQITEMVLWQIEHTFNTLL